MLSKNCNKERTQTLKILNHIKNKGYITSFDAFTHYHATRLSGIIYRLREEGFEIDTIKTNINNKTFGKYVFTENSKVNEKLLKKYDNLIFPF